jgi:hypothetical protein
VIVNQDAPLVAVHGQPVVAVTAIVPAPPLFVRLTDGGDTVNAHAFWVTVTAIPATVSVPVRFEPVRGGTEYVTVPLPGPDSPVVTVIEASLLTAVHAHSASVATTTEAVPPSQAIVWLVVEIE